MSNIKNNRLGILLTKEQTRMVLEMAFVLEKDPDEIVAEALEEKYNAIALSQIMEMG